MISPTEEFISYDFDGKRYVLTRRAVVHTMAKYALDRGFCYLHTEYAIAVFMDTVKAWYSDENGEPVEFKQ